MRLLKNLSWTLFTLAAACGTQVDVGRNRDKGKERQDQIRRANGQGTSTEQGNIAKNSACFAKVDELSENLKEFCEVLPDTERQSFAKMYTSICEEKRFANLLHPDCGWDGRNHKLDFHRILESTDVDNSETDSFYINVAYSLTLPPNDRTYKDTVFFAYSNPQEFSKKFILPESTTITPSSQGVQQQNGAVALDYGVEVESKYGVMRFQSRMKGMNIGETFTVVMDQTVDQLEGINMRRNLSFGVELPDGREKVVVFEERDVPDQGRHKIAAPPMKKFDLDRMDLIYENSLR